MTAEEQKIGTKEKSSASRLSLLPWIVAAGALLLYLVTLNHWVTLSSLPVVSKVTGWDWHPGYEDWRPTFFMPLLYLATFPFKWLPTSIQPVALNLLTAVFAALTLALLARSVRLLPQDRTREQRVRHLDPSGYLSGWRAYLPPVVAVLICGLQLTFWENSVAVTGEMLDLLIFAYLIRCLLEFRNSRKEVWLTKLALVYGLGVTNNWALIGFFPFFLISLVWLKGLSFFNWRFVGKMVFVGLAGLSLYLLLPIIYSINGDASLSHLLATEMKQQVRALRGIPRWVPFALSLPTLVALFFAGIRWPSFQGDFSAIGNTLSTWAFRFMHLLLFALGIWFFIDIRYSPRVLGAKAPFITSWLTFYYMAALAVGYFSGYILLVFGTEPVDTHLKRTGAKKLGAQAVTFLALLAMVAAPIYLIVANIPKILASNSPALSNYAKEMLKPLPEKGAVVLSDDRTRLELLQAYCARENKPINNMLFETGSLQFGKYLAYLYDNNPGLRQYIRSKEHLPPVVDQAALIGLLSALNMQTNGAPVPIYYLHPSFGYYFERFYAVSHGIDFELKPKESLEIPAMSANEIAENQKYWDGLQPELKNLPALALLSSDAKLISSWYSRSLNYWGVELQKANLLKEANKQFALAVKLNPQNQMAEINRRFNENLQNRNAQPLDCKELVHDAITQYHSWETILSVCGPVDEPGLQLSFGQALAMGNNVRQAYNLFQRRLQLNPGDYEAQIALAKTYVDLGDPDKGLAMVQKVKGQTTNSVIQVDLLRVEVLAYMEKNEVATAETILKAAVAEKPKDEMRVGLLADFYRMSGLDALRKNQPDLAKTRFKSALGCLDTYLVLLKAAHRSTSAEECDVMLRQAQLQIQLGDYPGAITNLNQILKRQPDNASALMNRAIANLQSKKLAQAKTDYKTLLKQVPEGAYAVYFGLAEIAYQEKDKPEAIKNYKLYLKYAPPAAPEYKMCADRLQELERGL